MLRISRTRVSYLALGLLVMFVVYSSGHGHEGNEENPAYKYSRQANEQAAHAHAHAHSHGGGDAHHGHAHGHGHGHSHGGAGHHHGHNHHGHSHDHDDDDHGHGHHHSHEQPKKRAAEPVTPKPASAAKSGRDRFSIALHALGSTALISVAPFLILFFIPLNDNKDENQALLKVMLAFASGSLLGDAFLHLIPHALEPHDHSSHSHSHSHSHSGGGHGHGHDHSQQTNVGLWVMGGILTFLLVEKLIMSFNGGEHTHSHSSKEASSLSSAKHKKSDDEEHDHEDEDETSGDDKKSKKDDGAKKRKGKKDEAAESPKKKPAAKTTEVAAKENKHEGIKVAGYLNLAADFAHNFTDGLAIGASFLAGQNLGIITTFTILFHEVPHEIGDFAILIQSGCSKRKAIFLQLVTALGALSGTLLSLLFESAMSGFAAGCILPFTAGGFIYIATVTIIPELKEKATLWQSIKEILALVAGVAMMVVISYYE